MTLDIQWYFNNVQLRASEKYRMVVQEQEASLEIMKITSEDCGYYNCKLINEIGMTMTRAKFDISSTSTIVEETKAKTTVKKKSGKKTMVKRSGASESQNVQKTEIRIIPTSAVETSMNVIKVKQPVSVLVEKSEISEVLVVKDREVADAEERSSQLIEEIEEEEEIEEKVQHDEEDEVEVQVEQKETYTSSKKIEITKTVELIRTKISEKIITIEDVQVLSHHEEVQWLLESIEAESFGQIGESALRDLATIGLLLRYGCEHYEITYMYEQNIFISLKKPESQSALVQLVEREGHEELISQILSESSNEDETILAATVGFKAFIRMIQTYEITIEIVIRKFVREDFISQDWKICGKEV